MGGLDLLELGTLGLFVDQFPGLDQERKEFLPLLFLDLVLGVVEFY